MSDAFIIPVDASITMQTIAVFLEPDSSPNAEKNQIIVRSGVNVLKADILDSNILNNAQNDTVLLQPTSACEIVNLKVTKTQISPGLPNGESSVNPIDLGEVSYETTVENRSDLNTFIEL